MAIDARTCTVSKCATIIDERALASIGMFFLATAWVTATRAGTTTKCLAHYLDTDQPAAYKEFFAGSAPRRNRERS